MAKAKESKKQLVELRDPELSSRFKLEPTFDWIAFPALTWAFYTLSSEDFMSKATAKIQEIGKVIETDPGGVLERLVPAYWIYKRLTEVVGP